MAFPSLATVNREEMKVVNGVESQSQESIGNGERVPRSSVAPPAVSPALSLAANKTEQTCAFSYPCFKEQCQYI